MTSRDSRMTSCRRNRLPCRARARCSDSFRSLLSPISHRSRRQIRPVAAPPRVQESRSNTTISPNSILLVGGSKSRREFRKRRTHNAWPTIFAAADQDSAAIVSSDRALVNDRSTRCDPGFAAISGCCRAHPLLAVLASASCGTVRGEKHYLASPRSPRCCPTRHHPLAELNRRKSRSARAEAREARRGTDRAAASTWMPIGAHFVLSLSSASRCSRARSGRRPSFGPPLFCLPSRDPVRYRGLFRACRGDLNARYRGSALGFLWSFINPSVPADYTFVFAVVLRRALEGPRAVILVFSCSAASCVYLGFPRAVGVAGSLIAVGT